MQNWVFTQNDTPYTRWTRFVLWRESRRADRSLILVHKSIKETEKKIFFFFFFFFSLKSNFISLVNTREHQNLYFHTWLIEFYFTHEHQNLHFHSVATNENTSFGVHEWKNRYDTEKSQISSICFDDKRLGAEHREDIPRYGKEALHGEQGFQLYIAAAFIVRNTEYFKETNFRIPTSYHEASRISFASQTLGNETIYKNQQKVLFSWNWRQTFKEILSPYGYSNWGKLVI